MGGLHNSSLLIAGFCFFAQGICVDGMALNVDEHQRQMRADVSLQAVKTHCVMKACGLIGSSLGQRKMSASNSLINPLSSDTVGVKLTTDTQRLSWSVGISWLPD